MHALRYLFITAILILFVGPSVASDQHSFDRAKEAIRHHDLPALQKMAEQDPSVLIYRDDVGNFTLLHIAAMNSASKVVKYLLSQQLDPNAIDAMTMTPITWSIVARSLETFKALADGGATLHVNDSTDYLLNDAITSQSVPIVKYLLENGFSSVFRSGMIAAPIRSAAFIGNTEIAALLLTAGADINTHESDGETALVTAIKQGNTEMVKFLLEHGARQDLDVPTATIPIIKAIKFGRLSIATLLVKHGADLKCPGAEEPIICALARFGDDTTMANLLYSHGMPIRDVKEKSGGTPIQLAIWYKHHRLARWLIEHGADTDAIDSNGDSVFSLCQKASDVESMQLLQSKH